MPEMIEIWCLFESIGANITFQTSNRLEHQLVLVWLLQLMLLSLLATPDLTLLRHLSSRFVIFHSIFHLIGTSDSYTIVFQVLNIPTKINKGTVEIITPVELIKKGDKVGSSEAALLAKLGIRPFSYGLVVLSVYDNGSVFSPEVLDLTEDDLIEKFATGIALVTSLSLAISYPTLAAAPHMFINGYKNVLAIAIATEYSFPQAEKTKEFLKVLNPLFKYFFFRHLVSNSSVYALALLLFVVYLIKSHTFIHSGNYFGYKMQDPSKFAAVFAAVAAPVSGAAPAAAAAKEEEKKDEPAEESDDDMGFSLFD
jgi:large subunit ribosomal protein LP0